MCVLHCYYRKLRDRVVQLDSENTALTKAQIETYVTALLATYTITILHDYTYYVQNNVSILIDLIGLLLP